MDSLDWGCLNPDLNASDLCFCDYLSKFCLQNPSCELKNCIRNEFAATAMSMTRTVMGDLSKILETCVGIGERPLSYVIT